MVNKCKFKKAYTLNSKGVTEHVCNVASGSAGLSEAGQCSGRVDTKAWTPVKQS